MEYLALVSRFTWSRMIVCFIVLRASGSGGLEGWSDFGLCLLTEVRAGGLGVVVVVDVGSGGVVVGLPRHWQVTGVKAEVAKAHEIRAFVGA